MTAPDAGPPSGAGVAGGSALDPARRAALLGSLLARLVEDRTGRRPDLEAFPGGAAAVARSSPGGPVESAWILLEHEPARSLGGALVWAWRRDAAEVHVVAREATGVLARRAALFDPPPAVWHLAGDRMEPAVADPPPAPVTAPSAPALDGALVDARLELVVEDGILRGEVNGLEVARVVHGTAGDGSPLDGPRLEVGVGQADREMTALVHGGLEPLEQLERVATIVRSHRRPGAAAHPLNRLVPERWLRARLCAHPERLGLVELRPVSAAVPRANLRERGSAAALGTTRHGEPVVVACSVGVDLDLVPSAADTRAALAPAARLVVAVPERDDHPLTRRLAASLLAPAEIVALSGDWRA